jgi:coenzyme F420-reducing hydrogenase alpha subunit
MSNAKNPKESKKRTIRVGALARVEGEGALHLVMKDRQVEKARLEIFEPPRFYEAFLQGRDFMEVPDITSRICGICPIAYQTAACYALEKAMGQFGQLDPSVQKLRDLIYCGEWIESHVLHMFLLHLPDFLGYESVVSMARDHGDVVRRALRIKKAGNAIVELLGGRSVHPVGMCVGGFHSCPDAMQAASLLPELKVILGDMVDLSLFLAKKVTFPDFTQDYEFVALCPDNEYPLNLGRIKSSKGLDVEQQEFGEAIEEYQVKHSNALYSVIKGRGAYMVGPLARLNLNHEKLHPVAADLLPKLCEAIGKNPPWDNSFLNLLARALETVHALALAVDILESYEPPSSCRIPITPRAGYGGHGTEAPRGICWHEYRTKDDGSIVFSRIIPPTAQNQTCIEHDLFEMAKQVVDLDDEMAAMRCEHLIRNYDPCISCSVHFLKFERTWHEGASCQKNRGEALNP